MEKRTFIIQELRTAEDGKITGHAAVFNAISEVLWGFRETILPGAFAGVLQDDVRALFNHDPNYVLGRTKSGTLRIKEDEKGLAVEIDPPDTQWARDLSTSIKRGDINQMSFAFDVNFDNWRMQDGMPLREIKSFKRLYDVSPVTYPAYPDTDVQARSNVPDEIRKKAAEFIRSQKSQESEPPKEAGATEGPKWEESQERFALMRRRVELEEKN